MQQSEYGKKRKRALIVKIGADDIQSFDDFHTAFDAAMGFPEVYGRNMDVRIDCMTSLDDADSGLMRIPTPVGTSVRLHIAGFGGLKKNAPYFWDALHSLTGAE